MRNIVELRRVVFAVLAFVALARPISAEAGQGAIAGAVVSATTVSSRMSSAAAVSRTSRRALRLP